MNALQKRCSPLTRPVGPDKINRSVTVSLFCACLFDRMARAWRMAVNPMLRRFIAAGAADENHPQARQLRQALCIPSIHDPVCPEAKAEIFADEMLIVRAPDTPIDLNPYLKEFAQ